ncbi:hypothetical protein [Planctomicrobium sp. SH664]|uniref:hypothetical protein n=1 Tax=Planctomicrobium sp. SH664 TaxID=3448125 RepID=UPI003F5AF74F
MLHRCSKLILLMSSLPVLFSSPGLAQDTKLILDHRAPTGVVGRVNLLIRPGAEAAAQPIRIVPPSTGVVSFYAGSPRNVVAQPAPAQASFLVGRVYRVKISDMPEFPGVEIFPTIELLDRLHPPAELVQEYPIPIELTEQEIEIVLQDRMVTKVVYLEQPDMAVPAVQGKGIFTEDVSPTANLLQAADFRGRPMAIVRIGGRVPDANSPADEFYSQSPVFLSGNEPAARPAAGG